jgi:hypothetical protein
MLAVHLITGQAYWWSGHSRARTAPEAHISSDVSPWVPYAGETHRYQRGFTGGTGQPSPRPVALTRRPRQRSNPGGRPAGRTGVRGPGTNAGILAVTVTNWVKAARRISARR